MNVDQAVESLDIHARFDGGALSSDGGVLLLREIERKLGFAAILAGGMIDRRDPSRTRHDPALKMACERLPESGSPLASQAGHPGIC